MAKTKTCFLRSINHIFVFKIAIALRTSDGLTSCGYILNPNTLDPLCQYSPEGVHNSTWKPSLMLFLY